MADIAHNSGLDSYLQQHDCVNVDFTSSVFITFGDAEKRTQFFSAVTFETEDGATVDPSHGALSMRSASSMGVVRKTPSHTLPCSPMFRERGYA